MTSALSLVAGRLLDVLGAGRAAFGIVLLVAAASAAPEVLLLRRIPAGRDHGTSRKPRIRLRTVLHDRRYLTWSGYVAAFYLALLLSDGYTYAHLLGNLELSTTTVMWFGLLGTLPQLLLLQWWGRRCDRLGHGTVLRIAVWFFALETLAWAMAGSGAAIVWVPVGFLLVAVPNCVHGRRVRPSVRGDAGRVPGSLRGGVHRDHGGGVPGRPCGGGAGTSGVGALGLTVEHGPVRAAYLLSTLALVLLQVVSARRGRRTDRPGGQRDPD